MGHLSGRCPWHVHNVAELHVQCAPKVPPQVHRYTQDKIKRVYDFDPKATLVCDAGH